MAILEKISNTSWKQPFSDRRKEFHLWNTHVDVAKYCELQDGTKRRLRINFEDQFNLEFERDFQITSGKEISFPRDVQKKAKTIILNHPESYFLVEVLDAEGFEIGGYKYTKSFGDPAIIPWKLKEDYEKGRRSTRTDLVLAVIKELKDERPLVIEEFCEQDFCAESFPNKINGFLKANNVPYKVEITGRSPRRGQGGKVSQRPLELIIRKLNQSVGDNKKIDYVYGIAWYEKDGLEPFFLFFETDKKDVLGSGFKINNYSKDKLMGNKQWGEKIENWPQKNQITFYKTHDVARNFTSNCTNLDRGFRTEVSWHRQEPKPQTKQLPTEYFGLDYILDEIKPYMAREGFSKDFIDEKISQVDKEALVKIRLQQSKYRRKLIARWNGCSVTGIDDVRLLIASHIKSYAESTREEKIDVNNGLLLTPALDQLFDQKLVSFTDDGSILLHKSVNKDFLKKLGIDEKSKLLKVYAEMKPYLAHHREKAGLQK